MRLSYGHVLSTTHQRTSTKLDLVQSIMIDSSPESGGITGALKRGSTSDIVNVEDSGKRLQPVCTTVCGQRRTAPFLQLRFSSVTEQIHHKNEDICGRGTNVTVLPLSFDRGQQHVEICISTAIIEYSQHCPHSFERQHSPCQRAAT